jgi:hypothetical protein
MYTYAVYVIVHQELCCTGGKINGTWDSKSRPQDKLVLRKGRGVHGAAFG